MHLTYRHRDRHLVVDVQRADASRFHVTVDGHRSEVQVSLLNASTLYVMFAGKARTVHLVRIGQSYHVAVNGAVYVLTPEAGAVASEGSRVMALPQIVAPMPGKVLQVLVEAGQEVAAGDGLLILEAMKMEHRIVAEAPAVVRKVLVSEGQMVDGGEAMLELEYRSED